MVKKLVLFLFSCCGGVFAQQAILDTLQGANAGRALSLKGPAVTNGNIILQPGNISGNSRVHIDAARTDTPVFIVKQTAGNVSVDVLEIQDNVGNIVFALQGAGTATPNTLAIYGNITPAVDNSYNIGLQSWIFNTIRGGTIVAGAPSSHLGTITLYSAADAVARSFVADSYLSVAEVTLNSQFSPTLGNTYNLGDQGHIWKAAFSAQSITDELVLHDSSGCCGSNWGMTAKADITNNANMIVKNQGGTNVISFIDYSAGVLKQEAYFNYSILPNNALTSFTLGSAANPWNSLNSRGVINLQSGTAGTPTAGRGLIWFDGANLKCSENGSAAVNCLGGGSVSAVTASLPAVSSGGTSPNISCPTCATTDTVQTISGAKTFTSTITAQEIDPTVDNTYNQGTLSNIWKFTFANTVNAFSINWLPGDLARGSNLSWKSVASSDSTATQNWILSSPGGLTALNMKYYSAGSFVRQGIVDMHWLPSGNTTLTLGTNTARWLKLWVQDIDISGTCTGCGSGGGIATVNPTAPITASIVGTTLNISCPDCATLSTNQTISGAKTFTSTITAAGVNPTVTSTYDLGSSSNLFRSLWLSDVIHTSQVYVGANQAASSSAPLRALLSGSACPATNCTTPLEWIKFVDVFNRVVYVPAFQ